MFTTLADSSVHETPNAVMRRYTGRSIAVWRAEMAPGATGPQHVVDVEQVVVVVEGRLLATVAGEARAMAAGDAVALPAGTIRQLANPHDTAVVTLTASTPGGIARVGDAEPVALPWGG